MSEEARSAPTDRPGAALALRHAPGHPIPALDGLRAASILVVMLSHSGLQGLVPGVFGVTVFFFISGFLITTLLMAEHAREGRIAVGAFTMRRLLRLYPPLVVFVGLSGAAWIAAGGRLDPLGVLGALAYLTNYLVVFAPERMAGIGGQLWSLAVEEHFYLVFPWLMLALLPRRGRVAAALALLCIAALGIRLAVAIDDPGFATLYTGVATECRIDAILFGALAALLRDGPGGARRVERLTRPPVVAAALLVLFATLAVRDTFFRDTVRYTLQGLALAPPVLALTSTGRYAPIRALLDSRPFVTVGILSYSLYLWHLAGLDFGDALAARAGWPAVAGVAVGWTATFALAAASYRFVEQPFFALRRRFGSRVRALPRDGAPLALVAPAKPS